MTQNSMFFSNGSWYTQDMFARFLKDIFGHDGVVDNIGNELAVSANSPANMAVSVATGRSYVQGYFHEILTDAVQLAISDADPTNPRIDRIVLRLDVNTNRSITVAVLAGTPAASPVAPTLTQTSTIWEVSLAQVRVDANATVINSGNITDERQYMWMNRDNMPKASTTEYGSMKVGYGLNVTNGVVAVSPVGNVGIPSVSITNNGGFAVGHVKYIPTAFSGSSSGHPTSWINIGAQYAPVDNREWEDYPPFAYVGELPSTDYVVNATIGFSTTGGASARAIRVSDSSVLKSITLSSTSNTMSFTLPADWDFDTDKIQFQWYMGGSGSSFSVSATVAETARTTKFYFNPVVGS